MLYNLQSFASFFKENPILVGVLAAILAVIIALIVAIIVLQVKGKKRLAEEEAQKAAAAGAPDEEPEPAVYAKAAEMPAPAPEQPVQMTLFEEEAQEKEPEAQEPFEEPAEESIPAWEASEEEQTSEPAEEYTFEAEPVEEYEEETTYYEVPQEKEQPAVPLPVEYVEAQTKEEPAPNAVVYSKEEKPMKQEQKPAQNTEPVKKGALVFKPTQKKEPVKPAPVKPAPVKAAAAKPAPAKATPAKAAKPAPAPAPAKAAKPTPAPAPKKESVSAVNGKWTIENVKGKFWFSLIAPNGQVMLESAAPYASLSSAKTGIKTYQDNIAADHLEIVEHKNGDSQVQILNGSGRLLATSSTYSTRSQAESARDSIKRWASTDAIEDPD